jgi:flavin reductase (DIM6/NTAB) family NADH-FMN oxidoreductase RutF
MSTWDHFSQKTSAMPRQKDGLSLNMHEFSVSLLGMKNNIDTAAFRRIMGCFTTGVAVVTALDAKLGAIGLTVNSLTSVSLDPPLMLVCLDKKAALHNAFRRADRFAFNILSAEQENISRHFADRQHNPAPETMWDKPQGACPILNGTLGWILCQPHTFHRGGDHTIFVGEVIDAHRREQDSPPLLYFHGRYRNIAAS